MQQTTDGIVLHLRKAEDDRILTILTRGLGVITAFANGANKMHSRLAASTELLCYSHVVLFSHKGRYVVDKADSERIFFGIREDMEKLALASYFAQLTAELAPKGEEAGTYLSLLLNTLHLLERDKRPPDQLKAVYELRLLTMAGFMPNLVGCRQCGRFEAGEMRFSPRQGCLLCEGCPPEPREEEDFQKLAPGVLAAMRHILYSEPGKLFSFALSGENLPGLCRVSEAYLRNQTERTYPALDFYNNLKIIVP